MPVDMHSPRDSLMNPSSRVTDGTLRQSQSQADPTSPGESQGKVVPDTPLTLSTLSTLAMSVVGGDGVEVLAPASIDESAPQRCCLCPASAAAVPIRDALTGKCNLYYVSSRASVVGAGVVRPGALVCEAVCYQNRANFPVTEGAVGRKAEAVLDLSCCVPPPRPM